MTFKSVTFGNLYLEPSRNGIYKSKQYSGSGTALIKMEELFNKKFIGEEISHLDMYELSESEKERFLVKEGDLIFSRTSVVPEGVGKCSIITNLSSDLAFESNLIRVRLDNKTVNPLYCFYYFQTSSGRGKIIAISNGVAVRTIRGSDLTNITIELPSLKNQTEIVNILSPYDDLIENNRRRIQLLEEAARLLYQEWFVRLRFPGHEHTKIVDGVPEGWRKSPLSELCELINYGYTESAVNEEIGPKFLRITDIVPSFINWDSVPYCKIEESKKEKFLLKEGDIVIARTGATVGYAKRINKRHPESVYASYLVRLRINSEIDNKIVGILLESDFYKEFVKSNISGAAQPNANAKVLTRFELLVAPKKIQQEFCDIISPILDQKEILQDLSQQLINARDLLLPRLMNGVIPV